MKVLGYNGGLDGYMQNFTAGHDAAAALVVDGEVVAACEEERFSREKHSGKFPRLAIEYCLREAGLRRIGDVDLITYYFSYPLMFQQGILTQNQNGLNMGERLVVSTWLSALRTYNRIAGYTNDRSKRLFERYMKVRLKERRFVPIPHHLCHVASTFYDSPFDRALCVTLDGAGESACSLVAVAEGTQIKTLHEVLLLNSLGALYGAFTAFLGFIPVSDEYKVMGLAPYGDRSRYRDFFASILKKGDRGRYQLDQRFIFKVGLAVYKPEEKRVFPAALVEALGPPRKADEPITQRHMDIAAGLQEVLENTVLHSLEYLRRETGQRNLCMAGGVALNSTMNGKIAGSGIFDQVWIHPAAHDAGTSLGAALFGYHNVLRQPRHFQKERHRYLGPGFDQSDIDSAIRQFSDKILIQVTDNLMDEMAQAIADGQVVGWYQGRMEWGPRALGNRSILADPRRDDMKDIVNHAVKLREGFRPFAPACLAERVSEWFDLTGLPDSPYMLFVVPVRAEQRSRIPAVTHVDGSARVQTVSMEENPRFHSLISAFERKTGVPVVLNTSFNVKGEPIVNTPADAIRCFLGTQIDLLVLHDTVIQKRPEVIERLRRERGAVPRDAGRVIEGRITVV